MNLVRTANQNDRKIFLSVATASQATEDWLSVKFSHYAKSERGSEEVN